MDSVWYYVRNGTQTGPVSFDELKSAAAAGQLAPIDLVWQEGTPDWVPARTVAGLFAGPPLPASKASALPGAPESTPAAPVSDSLPLGDPIASEPGAPQTIQGFALAVEFASRATATNAAAIQPTRAEDEQLTQAGLHDSISRKYAVWRRAVLWVSVLPSGLAALFGFINAIATDSDPYNGFGILVLYLEALVFMILPACAVCAALEYDHLTTSRRWVLLGAIVSIVFPLMIAFIPASWLLVGKMDLQDHFTARGELAFKLYFLLVPMLLALLPAMSRACIRVKTFLPQSLVPGWALVAGAPWFALLTLATFVLIYQSFGNVLLILGLALWIGAPLLFLTKYQLLTRPVTDKRALNSLASTQMVVMGIIVAGVLLLIIYLFTAKIGPMSLMGSDKHDSLLRPWSLDIHKKWIEYLGRALFMTVLFADLLTRMALSVWREERALSNAPSVIEFDKNMSDLSDAIDAKWNPAG